MNNARAGKVSGHSAHILPIPCPWGAGTSPAMADRDMEEDIS